MATVDSKGNGSGTMEDIDVGQRLVWFETEFDEPLDVEVIDFDADTVRVRSRIIGHPVQVEFVTTRSKLAEPSK